MIARTGIGRWRVAALATAAMVAMVVLPAVAEEPYTPAFSECMTRSGGVTVDMLNCIAAEHEVQDQRLNANYKALSESLSPERRKELVAVQRLWLQYRDANCRFHADPDGGSAAGLVANDCLLGMTAERAQALANLRVDDR